MTEIGAVRLQCPDCGFDETLIEQPWAQCTCLPEQGNTWRLHGDHYDCVPPALTREFKLGDLGTQTREFKIDLGKIDFNPTSFLSGNSHNTESIDAYARSVSPTDDPLTAKALRVIMLKLGLVKPTWRERLAVRIARTAVWLCRKIDPS